MEITDGRLTSAVKSEASDHRAGAPGNASVTPAAGHKRTADVAFDGPSPPNARQQYIEGTADSTRGETNTAASSATLHIDGAEYKLMLRVELYFTAATLAYGEAGRPPTAAYVAGFRDSQRSRAPEHERRHALSLAKQHFHAFLTSLEGSTESRGAHLVIGWGRHYAEEALRLLPATTPDILAGFAAVLDQLR
ncbi:hypothetical protein LTS09_001625 [Friedmanniomyces endolithicus]|nr:hypothetical protein LTS09_001625 [Friedmanniomyces endolithicus]